MSLTRRQAITAIGAAAAATSLRADPPSRNMPLLCLFSPALADLSYVDIGSIVKQIGFDGIDLTVRPGGHVEPRLSNVDLVRAVESITGEGLEMPMITTALLSPFDPTALAVLALSGRSGVDWFRPGNWGSVISPTYRRDIAGLVSLGSRYQIGIALNNYLEENTGEAPWEVKEVLPVLDPRWAGAYFDPIHALGNWEAQLKPLLPRLKAVVLKDYKLTGSEGKQKAVPCPLGEGVVDWGLFFRLLAQAKFVGTVSLRVEYAPKNALEAVNKDYQFARKQIDTAYMRMGSGSGAGSGSGPG